MSHVFVIALVLPTLLHNDSNIIYIKFYYNFTGAKVSVCEEPAWVDTTLQHIAAAKKRCCVLP